MWLLARVDGLHYLFAVPLLLLSVFLILVVLVQRGRGGGLTGALGGMGGQSAFGTKAGDLFTKITIVVAALWIFLSMAALKVLNQRTPIAGAGVRGAVTAPQTPGEGDSSETFQLPGGAFTDPPPPAGTPANDAANP
jgi:preprotein translocase subunit SecG